ncbi:DNA topoisomerase IV subunit A [Candidatus Bealeia paramacronuclearis]|uniref:DNA topoisomerase 4 subunit A n=1 Tax=Candidatus Bealeia paramacronuclearis TaxID=1921001 RepID=A0ABZ2C492_9PROT|nr:DNA topoisomerase IV subunit A [Candidatus Bealeia paramacronuclearis]
MTETGHKIRDVALVEALGDRYLSYALSTIMQRSLPDVRDGLKPVHRRVLYAMRELRLNPSSGYKKCARVVGDVVGKFHPHGESSIYDALVRLAQDFAVRYPLVDGQGNFGNIDGDSAAAMRYTEARLTAFAEALMEGIDEDAIDFRATYDGENHEPLVMPSAIPNILANGSAGIAVGMATSIPPHNLHELCDGLLLLLKKPEASIEELVELIPGPDFPTGGSLVEPKENILEAYKTGRGSFRIRAKWEEEKLEFGQYQIVITEIPYQVQKAKLVEKIADLLFDKKLPLIGNIRDESSDVMRLIIEPKTRTVDPMILMESLYKTTDLDARFSLNMNVLNGQGVPSVMNLKEVLVAFIAHRFVVLQRRTEYRLQKINHRLEMLSGFLIAYLNIDEVIRIIREEDEPAPTMMAKWGLSEIQAEAILNMRLRALRKLEEFEIRKEYDALSQEKGDLEALLQDPARQKKKLADEFKTQQKIFGFGTSLGARRTQLSEPPLDIAVPIEAVIERESVTVVCSKLGWLRVLKGHNEDPDLKYKDGDEAGYILKAETTDKLLVFSSSGRFYTIGIDKLPGGRGHGEPLRLMIDMASDDEVVSLFIYSPGTQPRKLLLASTEGRGFITAEDSVIAQTRSGKQILNVADKEKALLCLPVTGNALAVVGQNRKLLIFKTEEIPEMTRGRGVILQRYRDGGISDARFITLEEGLSWKSGERTRLEANLTPWSGKRASAGKLAPVGFPRNNKF